MQEYSIFNLITIKALPLYKVGGYELLKNLVLNLRVMVVVASAGSGVIGGGLQKIPLIK